MFKLYFKSMLRLYFLYYIYVFSDIINIKQFDLNNIKAHEKSHKKFLLTILVISRSKIRNT